MSLEEIAVKSALQLLAFSHSCVCPPVSFFHVRASAGVVLSFVYEDVRILTPLIPNVGETALLEGEDSGAWQIGRVDLPCPAA